MKVFKELREKKETSKGETVFSKRINKVTLTVNKEGERFAVFVNGEKLDVYKSQKQAVGMGTAFVKEM